MPMLFDHFGHGYEIGSYMFGNKWASINLTESVLSLPNNDRDKFANDFLVTPPQDGSSIFGLKMSNVDVDLESNFTSKILISTTNGHIHALVSKIDIDLDIELAT